MPNRDYADVPSKAFLEELLERAKRFGWSGDYIEVARFVQDTFARAGIELTDEQVEPYAVEEDEIR